MTFFDLTGRRALVTGASQGIGLALAQGLSEAGAEVVLNGRNIGKLEAAAETVPGARILPFDVTDRAAAQAAIDEFEGSIGPIDILVNNAGMQHRAPLDEFPEEAFDALLKTNIASVFHLSQIVARYMIPRGAGRIISISSVNAALARQTIAPYTATKGAVSNLTKGMATDWARHGLSCNAIAPGYFATPLNKALMDDPEFDGWLKQRTPAGRWGQLKELQGACIFLASDAASFVNGQTIFVDGGLTVSL